MTVKDLLAQGIPKALETLKSQGKDPAEIVNNVNEFEDNDRSIRPTQVNQVQKDKVVGEGESAKTVKSIKTPVSMQNRIVVTSCAFEVGKPPTLVPNEPNELFNTLLSVWDENRIDDKLQQLKKIQKVETEAAIQFFIRDTAGVPKVTASATANPNKDLRSIILSSKEGKMYPYLDATRDMTAFTWEFDTTDDTGKVVKNTWIWDSLTVTKIDDVGTLSVKSTETHGFDRIPIVYMSQDHPEWYIVEELIDRFEVALSKLGASNDYSGYPILKTYGQMVSLPGRNDDGKTLNFPQTFDEETQKWVNGDADFLTNANAVDSVKYEMEKIEELVNSISQTPNLSFEKMKSIGAVSGVALELMFMDPIIKALMNEGQNRTIVERMVNIMISGIVNVLVVSMKSQAQELRVKVKFNSFLPKDLQTLVTVLSEAVGAGIMSKETGVKQLGIVKDVDVELAAIKADTPTVTPKIPAVV